MGWRFRKSARVLGVRFNFGKSGLTSVSVGQRGFTMTANKKGIRQTVSFRGTGLSYSTFTPHAGSAAPRSRRSRASTYTPMTLAAPTAVEATYEEQDEAQPAKTSLGVMVWVVLWMVGVIPVLLDGLLLQGALLAFVAILPVPAVRDRLASKLRIFNYPMLVGLALVFMMFWTQSYLRERKWEARRPVPAPAAAANEAHQNRLQEFSAHKTQVLATMTSQLNAADFQGVLATAAAWPKVQDPDFMKVLNTARSSLARQELRQAGVPPGRQVELLRSIQRDSALTLAEQSLLEQLEAAGVARP